MAFENPGGTGRAEDPEGAKQSPLDDHPSAIDGHDRQRTPRPERVDGASADEDDIDPPGADPRETPPEAQRYRNAVHAPPVASETHPAVRAAHWYDCPTMAKAKRRKLRARRSKANHGRKPNAGRG